MNQQQIIHNHSSVSLVSPDSSPSSSSSLLPSSSTIPPSASPRSLESLSSPSSLESFSYHFTSADQWKKHHIIGRGGSSTVYKVELKQCGNILAMKEVQIDGLTKDQILAIEAEIETMKSLSNPNIVNYLGTFRHQNNFFMFLEYADGGSIRQFYQKNGRLDESQVCLCTKDMLYGLLYLHSNGIAHRDIKGANVLLTAKGEMKLADFGASKRLDTASIVSGLKGTPHWMAPEVIKGTQNSTGWIKADIWSLGCTVVEMITGALPFSEYANPMTAMYHIAGGKSPPISADLIVSSSLREFVSLCCAVEPNDRPTVEQLLQHPFILQCSDNRESMYCKSTDIPEKVNSKIENTGSSSSPSIPSLSSSSLSEISESRGQTSVDSEGSKTTVRVSEGQMVLQKLNRVVVIDTHTNSDQLASNESTLSQNQVTPVIHQTRKRRSSSNPAALQTLTTSRSSPLLPPTGKKNDKKNSLKPLSPSNSSSTSTSNSGLNSNSGSGSNPHAASPSSIIRGIPSVEDTERTTPSNRIDSSACPTPIMFSNNLRDVVSSASPSTTDLIDDKKNSVFGPCSLSNDLSEFQIPITISQELTPPPLSRSASLNDAIFDKKEGVLRPVAPLSGQKINICCDVEPKEVTPTKFIKKQPLQTLEKSKDSKSIKIITKPKSNSRSKSASVASSPNPNQMKIILPPMQSLSEGLNSTQLKSCQGQAVPELPLRLVQSAPCFTQSMTLPPLLSTSSPKRKSNYQPLENLAMTASCPSKLSNRKLLNHSQRRPSFEEYEQEGGILAPRR